MAQLKAVTLIKGKIENETGSIGLGIGFCTVGNVWVMFGPMEVQGESSTGNRIRICTSKGLKPVTALVDGKNMQVNLNITTDL